MICYVSRLPLGWCLHNEDHTQFVAVDGRLNQFVDRAYTCGTLKLAIDLFQRVAGHEWTLHCNDWEQLRLPEFNKPDDPTATGESAILYSMARALGNGIFCVNIYCGMVLDKQAIIDQLNIIGGNSRVDADKAVLIKHDNTTFFRRYLEYLRSQVEDEPAEMSNETQSHIGIVLDTIQVLINTDSIFRENVSLGLPSIQAIVGYHGVGPVLGNRQMQDATWADVMAVLKRVIHYISEFWL